MKHANSIVLSLALVFLTLVSCGQKRTIPENLVGVKRAVAMLDSAVTAMYGWEPRDSTYNHSLDTLVAGLMNDYHADDPEYKYRDGSIPAIRQSAYDEARVTWTEFKRLIDADKYEEALEFYLGEGDDYIKKNSGDFLVFLKHSTQRYVFFSDVLRRLMQEYKGDDEALNDYINNLQLEKALEDASIEMQADNTGYVPEVYPYVIRDLGMGLVVTGKMNEAQEMFSDMVNGVYSLTGDALYANFVGTQYAAQLYILDSKTDWALATWDNFKDYLKENESDYDPEDLAQCLAQIEYEMNRLQGKETNTDD